MTSSGMSDSGHAGRLKRSREEMVIESALIKVARPSSSSSEAGGFDRDANFARGRSAFHQMRPVSPLGRNATAHSAPPSGAQGSGDKGAAIGLRADRDSERKTPTGKFSIRGNAIVSGGSGAVSSAMAASGGRAEKGVGSGRKGASAAASTSNGMIATLASNNADTSKVIAPAAIYAKERIRFLSGSANGAGLASTSVSTGQSSSLSSGGQPQHAGKAGGKPVKILPAPVGVGASGGTTKSNGKGKNKTLLQPTTVRLAVAAAQHGNGGAAMAGNGGVSIGSSAGRSQAHAQQSHHQPGAASKKMPSAFILPAAAAAGGGGGPAKVEAGSRSSPIFHLPPADRSVSASPSTATEGDGDEPTEDGSSKAKRRRRTTRVPTPPPSSRAQQPTVSPPSDKSKPHQLPGTPPAAASSAGAPAAGQGGGGAGSRRSRRPPGAGAAPSNGRHSAEAGSSGGRGAGGAAGAGAGGGNGSSSSSSAGPVKKRSRPLIREEVRPGSSSSSSAGAVVAHAGGAVSPGRGAAGRGARGRGASRAKSRVRGRRRVLSLLESAYPKGPSNKAQDTSRWRTHRMVEDYVNTCGSIMYPKVTVGPFGYRPCDGRFPLERPTTLGMMQTELRRPTVIERWSPYQVALFEGAISIHGKVRRLARNFSVSKGKCWAHGARGLVRSGEVLSSADCVLARNRYPGWPGFPAGDSLSQWRLPRCRRCSAMCHPAGTRILFCL